MCVKIQRWCPYGEKFTVISTNNHKNNKMELRQMFTLGLVRSLIEICMEQIALLQEVWCKTYGLVHESGLEIRGSASDPDSKLSSYITDAGDCPRRAPRLEADPIHLADGRSPAFSGIFDRHHHCSRRRAWSFRR